MTKDLKQIQEENRKLILETISDGNTNRYLEKLATEKLLDNSDGPFGYGQWVSIFEGALYKSYPDINDDFVENDYLMTIEDFAKGLLTLSQVLLAFNLKDFPDKEYLISLKDKKLIFDDFAWDLTKETLEQQAPEVQITINQLLGK